MTNLAVVLTRVTSEENADFKTFLLPCRPQQSWRIKISFPNISLVMDIQVTLREEIKSACEYRPFEKCDYNARLSSEISCKKLEHVIKQLDGMKETVDQYLDST